MTAVEIAHQRYPAIVTSRMLEGAREKAASHGALPGHSTWPLESHACHISSPAAAEDAPIVSSGPAGHGEGKADEGDSYYNNSASAAAQF